MSAPADLKNEPLRETWQRYEFRFTTPPSLTSGQLILWSSPDEPNVGRGSIEFAQVTLEAHTAGSNQSQTNMTAPPSVDTTADPSAVGALQMHWGFAARNVRASSGLAVGLGNEVWELSPTVSYEFF